MNLQDYGKDIGVSLERMFARFYLPLLAALTVYSFSLSNNCSLKSAHCILPYWLDQWLKGYASGLTRRGFLGWLHSVLVGERVNLVALQLLGLFAIAIIFFIVYQSLANLAGGGTGKKLLALMVASPVLSVFFESLGDPMQLCLAAFGLSCLGLAKLSQPWQKAGLVFLAIGVTTLIHEASLLLIAPSYILMAILAPADNRSPRRLMLLAMAVLGVAALSYLIFLGGAASSAKLAGPSGLLTAFNPITGDVYRYVGLQSGTFMDLLKDEYRINFESYKHTIVFLLKPFRAGFIPVLFAAIIASACLSVVQAKRFLKTWLGVCLCSFPLFIMAHDWGRFAIYSLIVALLAQLVIAAPASQLSSATRWRPEMRTSLGFGVLVALATAPITPDYRLNGLPLKGTLAVALAAMTWMLFRRLFAGKQALLSR